jgi:hypothetical protein
MLNGVFANELLVEQYIDCVTGEIIRITFYA